MSELYTTGVPVPFECSFVGRVEDARATERTFHEAFGPYRINPSREFFEIEDTQAIALLRIISVEEVTPQINIELDQVDEASKTAGEKLAKKRHPRFNFPEMGIPIQTELRSSYNDETCLVICTDHRSRSKMIKTLFADRLCLMGPDISSPLLTDSKFSSLDVIR